jgi:hypothetical protein
VALECPALISLTVCTTFMAEDLRCGQAELSEFGRSGPRDRCVRFPAGTAGDQHHARNRRLQAQGHLGRWAGSARLSQRQVMGSIRFGVGALAYLLKNRFYIGEIVYRGETHFGEHEPILDRDLFAAVQAKLAASAVLRQLRLRGLPPCLRAALLAAISKARQWIEDIRLGRNCGDGSRVFVAEQEQRIGLDDIQVAN